MDKQVAVSRKSQFVPSKLVERDRSPECGLSRTLSVPQGLETLDEIGLRLVKSSSGTDFYVLEAEAWQDARQFVLLK